MKFECIKIKNWGLFTSDPILKITVIFSIYLQNTSSRKFMHVEKKANQDFARF